MVLKECILFRNFVQDLPVQQIFTKSQDIVNLQKKKNIVKNQHLFFSGYMDSKASVFLLD